MEVTFKIPEDLYAEYKEFCRTNKTLPANNLKQYMRACVSRDTTRTQKNAESQGSKLKLLVMNAHMRNTPTCSIEYKGDEETRLEELANKIVDSKADIVSVHEFAAAKGDRFLEIVKKAGYYEYFHPEYERTKCKRMWCLSVLLIKETRELSFKQQTVSGILPFRQVVGTLTYKGKDIDILSMHIVPVGEDEKRSDIERKKEHLITINTFVKGTDNPVIILGDLNTDIERDDHGSKELMHYTSRLNDITPVENSWNKKRLIRIFTNLDTKNKCQCAYVDNDVVRNKLTDHGLVGIEIYC